TRQLPTRSPTERASIRANQRSSAFPIVLYVSFELDWIPNQLQRIFPIIVAAVNCVHSGFVFSWRQFGRPKIESMPGDCRPSCRDDIWTRVKCCFGFYKSSVYKKLHLNSLA